MQMNNFPYENVKSDLKRKFKATFQISVKRFLCIWFYFQWKGNISFVYA